MVHRQYVLPSEHFTGSHIISMVIGSLHISSMSSANIWTTGHINISTRNSLWRLNSSTSREHWTWTLQLIKITFIQRNQALSIPLKQKWRWCGHLPRQLTTQRTWTIYLGIGKIQLSPAYMQERTPVSESLTNINAQHFILPDWVPQNFILSTGETVIRSFPWSTQE